MAEKVQGYRIVNMFKLMKKLSPYRILILLAVGCGIGHNLCNIAASAIGAYMVGLAIKGMLLESIKPLFIALISVILVRVLLSYGDMFFAHVAAYRILVDFRVKLYDAVEKVCPAILLNMRSGQLASTLMSDVEVLEWFFAHTFGVLIVAFVVPCITLSFMGTLYWGLPLIMIFFLAMMVVIPIIRRKKADAQGKVVREKLADANSVALEGFHGMREILTLNYKERYEDKNHSYMDKLYASQIDYGKRLGTEGGLLLICVGLAMISVMAVSALQVQAGTLSAEWYPVAIILAAMTFNPVIEISNMARNFGLIVAASNRVFAVMESKPLVEDHGTIETINKFKPSIEFEHVSFAYGEDLENALDDVSFAIKPGEMVALVGHSGAGKTTCINLLLRYWDVKSGSIKVSGKDIRDLKLDCLRSKTSAVLQEVYLFNISIMENIRLGRPDATDEEVINAAKAALAHDFIMSFPEGYETKAGERGVQLSGGQRQRIAIARAILKNSPILILDEAVSSLDAENENIIQAALKEMYKGRTTLVVAHRLSTIKAADRLIVMKEGKIVQIGSHEELINKKGYYRELIANQKSVS